MVFTSTSNVEVPHKHLLEWIFDGHDYDQDKPIYIDAREPTRSVSAAEARAYICKTIAGLRNLGVKQGDCILIHSFGELLYPILFLSIIGSGAIFLGSNPSAPPSELRSLLTLSSTKYIITASPQLSAVLEASKELIPPANILIFDTPSNPNIPPGFHSISNLLLHGEAPWSKTDANNTACFFTTSGTTGLPKVAEVSHRACIARCIASHDPKPKKYEVSRLLYLPMFHGVTVTAAHIDPLRFGYQTYILPRFDGETFLGVIERFGITEIGVVPTVLSLLLQKAEEEKGGVELTKRHLESLRLVRCAGAPLDVGTQRKFQLLLHQDAVVIRAWGLTEFGSFTSFSGGEIDHTGSCGRLLSNVEVKILDAKRTEIQLNEVIGDIWVRGPSMMTRYLNNEEGTSGAIVDGWLDTGDIAYCKDGKWYIVDRSKDMIKVRGWQVSPAEIEACLLQHPQVLEVSVIGIKSPIQESEMPRAYVVLRKEGADAKPVREEDLKELVRSRLAKYKSLDGGVRMVDALPKTTTGKVLKRVLRELAIQEQ